MKRLLYLLLSFAIFSCEHRNGYQKLERPAYSDASETNMSVQVANYKPPVTAVERKLIRTGGLDFQTKNVGDTKIEIEKICKELGGYISTETQNNYGSRLNYTQEIRVPTEKFFDLIDKIEKLGSRTESKHINTQDVTEEFIDVEARLRTKKELETRYHELLKLAKSLTDVIAIESQIATVRSEIESMQGRLNYLQNQVSFSTLTVNYFENIGTDFGFASKFADSLRNGWDYLLSALIGLISLWPFIILLVAAVWFVVKRRAKRSLLQREASMDERAL
jgi:hypothetical protein